MRQLVERDGRRVALAAFVAVLAVGIYDRWTWDRRLAAAVAGHRELVLNAGAIALNGGTVTVIGRAAGTHGRQ
jgi:hypothetical protein